MEVCKICQVEKHGLVFKTEYDRKNGTTSSPDFVKTRICRYAKNQGCINVESKVDPALAYNPLGVTTEQWLDTAKELIEAHKVRMQIEGASTTTATQNLHAVPVYHLAS